MSRKLYGVLRPKATLHAHLRPSGGPVQEIARITQSTGASPSMVMSQAAVTRELSHLASSKLEKNQGAEHAGQLLYISENGHIAALGLGPGLSILNGRLCITEMPEPGKTVLFEQFDEDTTLVYGAAFSLQEEDAILWKGVLFVPGEEENTIYMQ